MHFSYSHILHSIILITSKRECCMMKLTKSNLQQKRKGKPGCRTVCAQKCICASSPNANGRVAWSLFWYWGRGFYTTVARCTCFEILVFWGLACTMSVEAGVKNNNFLKLQIWSIFSVVLAWSRLKQCNVCGQFPTIIWRICTGLICRNFVFVKQVWKMPNQAPVPCASCASWCASYASCASWCAFWQRRDAQNLKTPTSRMRRAGNIIGKVVPAACSQTKKQSKQNDKKENINTFNPCVWNVTLCCMDFDHRSCAK